MLAHLVKRAHRFSPVLQVVACDLLEILGVVLILDFLRERLREREYGLFYFVERPRVQMPNLVERSRARRVALTVFADFEQALDQIFVLLLCL